MVLDYLKMLDGKEDYSAYIPSNEEMIIIDKCLGLLPPLTKNILKERLIGISFVNTLTLPCHSPQAGIQGFKLLIAKGLNLKKIMMDSRLRGNDKSNLIES